MKIALAQVNTTVGDFEGNAELIMSFYTRACKEGADLVIFPEMVVCGYPPRDLLDRPSFLDGATAILNELAGKIQSPAAIVGTILPNNSEVGRPLFNSAAFLSGGRIEAVQHKTLLPTYDVFDEGRYFEQAREHRAISYRGIKIAMCWR